MVPLEGTQCCVCGEGLTSGHVAAEAEPRCGLCRRKAPPFKKAVAYGAYQGALRDLIHLYKYQGIRSAKPLLGRLIAEALAGTPLPYPLLVVPVPLFKSKLRTRGFNQAEEIGRALTRMFAGSGMLPGIQLDTTSLARRRATTSQTGLTRPRRSQNVRGAFTVTRPDRIQGQNILVVDDVMTTGTTASECARVLRRAGAKQVLVATVARAMKETAVEAMEAGVPEPTEGPPAKF